MPHYKYRTRLVATKAKKDDVEELFAKHGYEIESAWQELHSSSGSSNAPATHYMLEAMADEGMLAVFKLAKDINGVRLTNGKMHGTKKKAKDRQESVAQLKKINLKKKPRPVIKGVGLRP